MKVVLIGGGSPSTPTLIACLASYRALPPLEVVLLSTSETSLRPVAFAAEKLVGRRPIRVLSVPLTNQHWAESLAGADVILLQVRIGGYEARKNDETFPLEFDICGDQDLGPGGLANAWRSWPQVEPFFVESAARAPKATFLVLSSPVGILVRLGSLAAPRMNIAGICELPWLTMLLICSTVNVPCCRVDFGYIGLHHLGWFYHLESGMRDLIEEYANAVQGSPDFPSAPLVQQFSAIPTRYAQLHFDRALVIAKQKQDQGARSRYLAEYRKSALEIFTRGNADGIKAVLERRPAPWYSQAIAPLIAALNGVRVTQPFFLSRPNGGVLDEFEQDDVLELPYHVRNGKLRPLYLPRPIPKRVLTFIRQFVEAERLAADGVWRRDPITLRRALAAHPWTKDKGEAQTVLLQRIMAASPEVPS
jgi:6-phospho-beta-glucosidase